MLKARSIVITLALLLPLAGRAATLSISPASGSFEVGDRVSVRVVVSSSQPINAVSGAVEFPTNLFTVDGVSKAGSILNFWVTEPGFSQAAGELNFEGVALGGYPGGTATVITVTLHARKEGTGTITFKSGSVLANDGQGTDVTDGLSSATYSVTPASAPTSVPATAEPSTPEPLPAQPIPTTVTPAPPISHALNLDLNWEIDGTLLILLIVLIIFITIRTYMVRKEARETEALVREAFRLIHDDLDDGKSSREVSKELREAEGIILKEVKKIEHT